MGEWGGLELTRVEFSHPPSPTMVERNGGRGPQSWFSREIMYARDGQATKSTHNVAHAFIVGLATVLGLNLSQLLLTLTDLRRGRGGTKK